MEEHVVVEVRLLGQCLRDAHLSGEDVAHVENQLDDGGSGLLGAVQALEAADGSEDQA